VGKYRLPGMSGLQTYCLFNAHLLPKEFEIIFFMDWTCIINSKSQDKHKGTKKVRVIETWRALTHQLHTKTFFFSVQGFE
jgi:hypothetical protein